MRKEISILFSLVMFLASALTFADFNGPFLVKSESPGFMPEWLATSFRCEIYKDKIVLTKSSGQLQAVEKRKIQINGQLLNLIEEAEKGELTEPGPMPSDAPSRDYVAYKEPSGRVQKKILLHVETPPGSVYQENQSQAAIQLKNFLDLACR